jgi:flavin-dependent dehydrogenase
MHSDPTGNMQMTDAEVAIIGAGPAGSVAALVLARAGHDVVVVTGPVQASFQVGEGLPPAARPLLDRLELSERFAAGGHLVSYGNRSAWGSDELIGTDFIFSLHGHGWHLDRSAFDRMLLDAAVDAGARTLPGARLLDARRERDAWRLAIGREEGVASIVARRVIDCSGRRAAFASALGVRRMHYDRLVAHAALLEPEVEGDLDSTTTIESVPGGWWYTALLPGGRRIMVRLTDGDLLDVPGARTAGGWLAPLDETIHMRRIAGRFGYRIVHGPWVTAAGSSRLASVAGEGWRAAGDAATAFDPLSSQGIVTAMASGRHAAASTVAEMEGDVPAVGSYSDAVGSVYEEYLRNRTLYYAQERRWPEAPFWRRRTGKEVEAG